MWQKLIRTQAEVAPLVARLALGIAIFPHGAQKLLGWFGGYGLAGTLGYFTSQGIPSILALLAIVAEFFGSLGLITGLLSRVAAFGISCVMVVAVATVHLGNGFFMNWLGNQQGEGFEYHFLALGLASITMVRGAGAYSVDRVLHQKG